MRVVKIGKELKRDLRWYLRWKSVGEPCAAFQYQISITIVQCCQIDLKSRNQIGEMLELSFNRSELIGLETRCVQSLWAFSISGGGFLFRVSAGMVQRLEE